MEAQARYRSLRNFNVPLRSERQRRLMYSAAAGDTDKVPAAVAKEFIASDKGGKLHEKAPSKRKGLSYKSMD